jgi:MYXO-CTERM domain-containing protein
LFASDLDADKSGIRTGALGDVTAVASLTGVGGTSAFLVGGSDGYLYAIDACSTAPTLLWSLDFRAPVGQAVFADYDGDGDEEIVVDAADGFVYGVDTERFPAPTWVFDTDPRNGITDADVDEVRGTLLGAAWADVPGATGYEWALFTAGGTAITRRTGDPGNPFIPVAATSTTVTVDSTDGLVNGTRYFFAVRAIGPGGSSAEALSDGVLYTETHGGPEPDAGDAGGSVDAADSAAPMDASDAGGVDAGGGPGSGCACRTAAQGSGRDATHRVFAFLVLAVVIGLRRRRGARDRAFREIAAPDEGDASP